MRVARVIVAPAGRRAEVVEQIPGAPLLFEPRDHALPPGNMDAVLALNEKAQIRAFETFFIVPEDERQRRRFGVPLASNALARLAWLAPGHEAVPALGGPLQVSPNNLRTVTA